MVFLVFLVGGAFAVVEQTGALGRGMGGLLRRLDRREALVIPIASLAFAVGGATEHMQEEIIAFVPVLLLLTRRLGFDPLIAVVMSLGSASIGAAFSPIDPFQVGIAQKLAELPLLSGGLFRTVFLALAMVSGPGAQPATPGGPRWRPSWWRGRARGGRLRARAPASFWGSCSRPSSYSVLGILQLGWGFDELSAVFFVMGLAAGLVAGLGWSGTAEAFVTGFRSMAGAAMLVGFARAIYVALDQGQILDTVVHGLFTPLADLPVAAPRSA